VKRLWTFSSFSIWAWLTGDHTGDAYSTRGREGGNRKIIWKQKASQSPPNLVLLSFLLQTSDRPYSFVHCVQWRSVRHFVAHTFASLGGLHWLARHCQAVRRLLHEADRIKQRVSRSVIQQTSLDLPPLNHDDRATWNGTIRYSRAPSMRSHG